MVENWKLNEIKCKGSLLEVSSYWIWVLKVTEGFLGRMTYSHLPNRIFFCI